MPELPEVETIRRQMNKTLKGRPIKSVDVRFAKKLNVSAKIFSETVTGSSFKSVDRRAKLLLIHLSNGWTIVAHLKMTGKFLLKKASDKPGPHTHVIFHLDGNENLWFDDIRKFGYLKLVKTDELEKITDEFGPEPLDPKFTTKVFEACLANRKKRIKPLLMEPSCVAGIGNIYADEALWLARVRPTRLAAKLTHEEIKKLHEGVLLTLNESLKHRGASADNYRDLYDKEGESVPFLHAYGKAKCQRCHGPMKKIYIGARSAHYCPNCQK